MKPDRFKELLDELDSNSLQTLKDKNAKYAKNGDSLYNFKAGAEIMDCTPAQACWNYMAKHLAELRGKIEANDFSDRADFLEKCQDSINYFRFLWCIGNDEMTTPGRAGNNDPEAICTGEMKDPYDGRISYADNKFRVYFDSIELADGFLGMMTMICDAKNRVTKNDMYSYLGLPRNDVDFRFGWTTTADWEILEEFCIDPWDHRNVQVIMPRPKPI